MAEEKEIINVFVSHYHEGLVMVSIIGEKETALRG